MLNSFDVEMQLKAIEPGKFQRICNRVMTYKGYVPYKYTGSVVASNMTSRGTPDSVFCDSNGNYVYVEMTIQSNISNKLPDDIRKCLKKINGSPELKDKVSEIVFFHNGKNIEETQKEQIDTLCGDIQFKIYGYEFLTAFLCDDGEEIAVSEFNGIGRSVVINNEFIDDETAKLYREASAITNTVESMIRITKANSEKLKSIFNKLSAYEKHFKDVSIKSEHYYNNMLAIAVCIPDFLYGDFQLSIPTGIAKKPNILYLQAVLLAKSKQLTESEDILKSLYESGNKSVIYLLAEVLYDELKYDEVIKLISPLQKEELDSRGILAALFVKSKVQQGKYANNYLNKISISKFANMPLYYAEIASLLSDKNLNKNDVKRFFKKAVDSCKDGDIFVTCMLCDIAMHIEQTDDIKDYLRKTRLDDLLLFKYCQLLCMDSTIDMKDLLVLEKYELDVIDNVSLKEFLLAKIDESKGLTTAAIKKYKDNYIKNHDINSGISFLMLSLKDKSTIDRRIIDSLVLERNNDFGVLKLCSQAYFESGLREGFDTLYKAIYLTNSNEKKDLYRTFWYYSTTNNFVDTYKEIVSSNSVVVLSNNKDIVNYCIEDDTSFEEGRKIADAIICRSTSKIGMSLLGSKKDDIVKCGSKSYLIKNIFNKYSYIALFGAKTIEPNEHVQLITAENGDINAGITQIKKILEESNKQLLQRYDIYKNEKYIPMSVLVGKDRGFIDYYKHISYLLHDSNYPYYAGEPVEIKENDYFLLDITSIVVMWSLNVIDNMPDRFYERARILASTKKKFTYFYQSIVNKKEDKSERLFIDSNNELKLSEISLSDEISFWKALGSFLEKITVIDYETKYDDIIKNDDIYDKSQIDSLKYAKDNNMLFICDDLAVRIISNINGTKTSNSISLIANYIDNYALLMAVLCRYAEANYVYSIYPSLNTRILLPLMNNFEKEDYKALFKQYITALGKNEQSRDYHDPILEMLKKIILPYRYIEFNDTYVYENTFVSFIAEVLERIK